MSEMSSRNILIENWEEEIKIYKKQIKKAKANIKLCQKLIKEKKKKCQ